jgi:hypothetical protein
MCNVAPDVLPQYRNKSFDNFEMHAKALSNLHYEECKGCDKEHMVLRLTTVMSPSVLLLARIVSTGGLRPPLLCHHSSDGLVAMG